MLVDVLGNGYEGRLASRPDPAFARHFSSYTRRYLSFESNMINALRGILSGSPLASYWGIPIFKSDPKFPSHIETAELDHVLRANFPRGFVHGLRWHSRTLLQVTDPSIRGSCYPTVPSTKRPGFPSWLWASTSGRIEYEIDYCFKIGKPGSPKNEDLSFDGDTIHACAEMFIEEPPHWECYEKAEVTRSLRDHGPVIRNGSR